MPGFQIKLILSHVFFFPCWLSRCLCTERQQMMIQRHGSIASVYAPPLITHNSRIVHTDRTPHHRCLAREFLERFCLQLMQLYRYFTHISGLVLRTGLGGSNQVHPSSRVPPRAAECLKVGPVLQDSRTFPQSRHVKWLGFLLYPDANFCPGHTCTLWLTRCVRKVPEKE